MTETCDISNAIDSLNVAHDAVVWGNSLDPLQLACVTNLILSLTTRFGPEYFTDDEVDLINEMQEHCIDFLQGDAEDDNNHAR
jgi:hypothetical protein